MIKSGNLSVSRLDTATIKSSLGFMLKSKLISKVDEPKILLSTQDGIFTIQYENRESSIRRIVENCDIHSEGSIIVGFQPLKIISEIKGLVSLAIKGEKLLVSSTGPSFTLNPYQPNNSFLVEETIDSVNVGRNDLKKGSSIKIDQLKPILYCVGSPDINMNLIHIFEDGIAVGDGSRFAFLKRKTDTNQGSFYANYLGTGDKDDLIVVPDNKRSIYFASSPDSYTRIQQVEDNKSSAFRNMMNLQLEDSAFLTVVKSELQYNVGVLSNVSDTDQNRAVRVTSNGSSLDISVLGNEIGTGNASIEVLDRGADIDMLIQPKYLLDSIANVSVNNITLHQSFVGKSKVLVIYDGPYIHLMSSLYGV